jgi:serine phosphatase RsbU (regulator of sigma subunit)
MAALHILCGPNAGTLIPLERDKVVLGRNPDCDVVIPVTSVSREHAQILRNGGCFFILDLQSRNGTFVNNQQIGTRMQLQDKDRIRICDFVASFQETNLPPLSPELAKGTEEASDKQEPDCDPTCETTIIRTNLLPENASQWLKGLLEISRDLSGALELDPLLPRIVDGLFQLFKQADRCFIILLEEGTGKPIPKVMKARRPQDEENARFSCSIVRKCLESSSAFLSDDTRGDEFLTGSAMDSPVRSVMAAPLVSVEGKAFGVILLDTHDPSQKFTQDDLELLWCVAYQAALAMEGTQLHEAGLEQARVKRELALAHQVQLSFLPQGLPEVPGYEFFPYYEPAQQVGGDMYSFISLRNKRLAVAVSDVAGKGMPAAVLGAKVCSDIRYALLTEPDAAAAVSRLNALVYSHSSQIDRFITLAVLVLDPNRHQVTLVNASHPSPLLYRSSTGLLEEAMPRDACGMPLGIMEDQSYSSCEVELQPGDSLLLFTDGVTDAVNLRMESFGVSGIWAAVQNAGPLSPRTLGERIVSAVKRHAAGRSQHDDITLVCFGRTS